MLVFIQKRLKLRLFALQRLLLGVVSENGKNRTLSRLQRS